MVRKSSILDKIVNRFRSGPVQVESARNSRGARSDYVQVRQGEVFPGSRRKLSREEDAALAMSKSFGELTSLLRGVQVRMEDQGGRVDEIGQNLEKLPETATAQLDVLKTLVTQLERQNDMNGKMVKTFAELPDVMKGVRTSLERSAATDERTAQTLDSFKSTMDRIHHSMGDMVDSSKVQADAATSLADDHKETVRRLDESTKEGLKALRWAQEDQANRMVKLVSETGRWSRAIVVLMIMSVAALVSILAVSMNS